MKHEKVQVWIHRQNGDRREVLLLKTRPDRGGFWQPVTGGVHQGEGLDAAALREAREETGLSFEAEPRLAGFEFTYSKKGKSFHETVYSLAAPMSQVRLDPKEHVDFKWESPEAALEMVGFESNAQPLMLLIERWKPQP